MHLEDIAKEADVLKHWEEDPVQRKRRLGPEEIRHDPDIGRAHAAAQDRRLPVRLPRQRRAAPTSDRAPVAVPKTRQCPSNWMQSGAYCIEMRRR
jgi:hypothetical protein